MRILERGTKEEINGLVFMDGQWIHAYNPPSFWMTGDWMEIAILVYCTPDYHPSPVHRKHGWSRVISSYMVVNVRRVYWTLRRMGIKTGPFDK